MNIGKTFGVWILSVGFGVVSTTGQNVSNSATSSIRPHIVRPVAANRDANLAIRGPVLLEAGVPDARKETNSATITNQPANGRDSVYLDPSSPDYPANKLRRARALTIQSLGYDVDWTRYSAAELLDMELRIRKAQDLEKLGYQTVWEVQTLDQLKDKEARIRLAASLEKKGVEMNWRKYSLADLRDTDQRIRAAERLKKLGRPVDWEKYSLSEMAAMESDVHRFAKD